LFNVCNRDGRRDDALLTMSRPDRLSGLDVSLLHLEERGAHMHVGSCLLFEGTAPAYGDFSARLESRLHLVPRYRQKLAFVPLEQGRPVWIDDPFFKLGYHVRHTALPGDAGWASSRSSPPRSSPSPWIAGKPLWEVWLVEGVAEDHWALVQKVHFCLAEAARGEDLTSVLFDSSVRTPAGAARRRSSRGRHGPNRAPPPCWPTQPSTVRAPRSRSRAAPPRPSPGPAGRRRVPAPSSPASARSR
jgi:hypothetical protein